MDDPTIARLFYDAGVMLGKQMKALVKKIPDEDMVGKRGGGRARRIMRVIDYTGNEK